MIASGVDQEDERKRTADDVSKSISQTSKPGAVVARDEFRGSPADCLSGVRHEGGVSLIQALMRNRRTCRLDAKGGVQAGGAREDARTDARHRGGAIRSSQEASQRWRSEGVASFRFGHKSTGDGRSW